MKKGLQSTHEHDRSYRRKPLFFSLICSSPPHPLTPHYPIIYTNHCNPPPTHPLSRTNASQLSQGKSLRDCLFIIYTSPPSPLKNPWWPEALIPSLTILSASPTCFLSVISRFRWLFRFICLNFIRIVNPRVVVPAGAEYSGPTPLMTADCYWRGSEELESRFRCRYTSVPYL